MPDKGNREHRCSFSYYKYGEKRNERQNSESCLPRGDEHKLQNPFSQLTCLSCLRWVGGGYFKANKAVAAIWNAAFFRDQIANTNSQNVIHNMHHAFKQKS